MWRSGTEGGVHHHTLSCFLTPLVNWLSNQSQESCIPTHILLDSLLTALAALEGLRSGPISTDINKFRLWDDESIWQLAIYSPRCDLIVASEFQLSKTRLSDSLHHCQQPLLQTLSWQLQNVAYAMPFLVQRLGII